MSAGFRGEILENRADSRSPQKAGKSRGEVRPLQLAHVRTNVQPIIGRGSRVLNASTPLLRKTSIPPQPHPRLFSFEQHRSEMACGEPGTESDGWLGPVTNGSEEREKPSAPGSSLQKRPDLDPSSPMSMLGGPQPLFYCVDRTCTRAAGGGVASLPIHTVRIWPPSPRSEAILV
jgi:hypothetical protein